MVPSRLNPNLIRQIDALTQGGTPFVLTDNTDPAIPVSQVAPDNIRGGYLAATHLLELGHRRIGIVVNNTPAEIPTQGGAKLRIIGIQQAYQSYGLTFDPAMIAVDALPYAEMGYVGTMRLLDAYPDLTAIFALTDEIALGAIRAAADRGVRVPEELSIIGYGNIPLGEHLVPRLTTINHSTTELADHSVMLLMEQMTGNQPQTSRRSTDVTLVVRQSTAPARS
jgi:LacI family transcriptional regulator